MEESEQHEETNRETKIENEDDEFNNTELELDINKNWSDKIHEDDKFFERKEFDERQLEERQLEELQLEERQLEERQLEERKQLEERQTEELPNWILEADEKIKTNTINNISNHSQIMSLIENIEKEIQLIKKIIKDDKKTDKNFPPPSEKNLRKISSIESSRSGRKR